MNPIVTAQYGLLAASRTFEASAFRVAAMGDNSNVDLGQEVVQQITAKHAFSANLGVIRTADEMLGDLLDMIA
jgi:flagellar hook protein FlgE